MKSDIAITLYEEDRDFESVIESCRAENWTKFFGEKKEAFRQALRCSVTYTAYCDNRYCGFIRCITDAVFTVYCCELIVDSAYRRMGIGRKLIETVSDQYPGCCIDVVSDNDSFYQANDFMVLGSGMRRCSQKKGQ